VAVVEGIEDALTAIFRVRGMFELRRNKPGK
jgi:hypothetical protein